MSCGSCTSKARKTVKSLGAADALQTPVSFGGAVFRYGEVLNLLASKGIRPDSLNQFLENKKVVHDDELLRDQMHWHINAANHGTEIKLQHSEKDGNKKTSIYSCGSDNAAFRVVSDESTKSAPVVEYRISPDYGYHTVEDYIKPPKIDIERSLLWNMTNDIVRRSIKRLP